MLWCRAYAPHVMLSDLHSSPADMVHIFKEDSLVPSFVHHACPVSCYKYTSKSSLFQHKTVGVGSGNVDDANTIPVVQSRGAEVTEMAGNNGRKQ